MERFSNKDIIIINKACFLNNIECNEIFFSKCTDYKKMIKKSNFYRNY